MPDIRIKDYTLTASAPLPPGTFVETDHATDGSRKLDLPGYVEPIAATRQGLLGFALSNGSDVNRRIAWTLGTAGNVAGSPLTEAGHLFRVPTSNPAAGAYVFLYGASETAETTWCYFFTVTTSGHGVLAIKGNPTSDYRELRHTSFRATYSGQLVHLAVVATPGASSPTIYVNGVDVTASFTPNSGGTPPDWMSSSLVPTYRSCGLNWQAGEIRPGAPINRALSAAEVAQVVQTGALLPSDRLGGSAVGRFNQANAASITAEANATTGAGWQGTGTIASQASPRSGSAGAYSLRGTATATAFGGLYTDIGTTFGPGITVRVTGWVRANAQAVTDTVQVSLSNDFTNLPSASSAFVALSGLVADTWTLIDAVLTVPAFSSGAASFSRLFIGRRSGSTTSGATIDLDDLQVVQVGALIQPEITRTAQVLDHGVNRIRGLMTAGMRPLCARDPEPVDFTLTTTGAFVTGGSTNPLWFEAGMLTHIWALADTAGADITLRRNSSSTNDIVTALTDIPTANIWVPLTLIDAQRIFAAGETLWGSASAGTIRFRAFWTRN